MSKAVESRSYAQKSYQQMLLLSSVDLIIMPTTEVWKGCESEISKKKEIRPECILPPTYLVIDLNIEC